MKRITSTDPGHPDTSKSRYNKIQNYSGKNPPGNAEDTNQVIVYAVLEYKDVDLPNSTISKMVANWQFIKLSGDIRITFESNLPLPGWRPLIIPFRTVYTY